MSVHSFSRAGALSGSRGPIQVAEEVLPGHPDRLADQVAERLVDRAVAHDPDALVGVEVAVHREVVYVTGRIAAGRPAGAEQGNTGLLPLELPAVVREVYQAAGYQDRWLLRPRVEADLDHGLLGDAERGIRRFSDDQNIVTGYACARPTVGHLPPAPVVARALRDALRRLRDRRPDRLGPDGKVLVRLREETGRLVWERCCVSLQHVPEAGFEELHALVFPALAAAVQQLEPGLPDAAATWDPDCLYLNGAGDFSCGGPRGDNGLSGKKLVVDHYGPGVPIGGGALCGKDPHKVDRVGPLRARQLAVRLVETLGAAEALVWLGYLPGAEAPDFLAARVDGEWWQEPQLHQAIPIPDLTLQATFCDLDLTRANWATLNHTGYFGPHTAWG